jgi:hypothetical protein
MTQLKFLDGVPGYVVDQARLPAGVASVRLATRVPEIAPLAFRARSMNLHEIDLKMVIATTTRLQDPAYPDFDEGGFVRVSAFEGALVAYCRCFDSEGRSSLANEIFNGCVFKDAHLEMRARRGGFVAHDSNGGRESEVFTDVKTDGTVGGTYLMSVTSPHVTSASISTLRTLAEFALAYAIEQQHLVMDRMRKIMKALPTEQVAALPFAQIRSPELVELSTSKPRR